MSQSLFSQPPVPQDSAELDVADLACYLNERGLTVTPLQACSIQQLLMMLALSGELARPDLDLALLIGPLVCTDEQEQQRFPAIFQHWLQLSRQHGSSAATAQTPALLRPAQSKSIHAPLAVAATVLILILAALALHQYDSLPPKPKLLPKPVPAGPAIAETPPTVEDVPDPPSDQRPASVPLPGVTTVTEVATFDPPVVPSPPRPFLAGLWRWLTLVPLVLLVLWTVHQWFYKPVLRRRYSRSDSTSRSFTLPAGTAILDSAQFRQLAQGLRQRHYVPSTTLDVTASLQATLDRQGFPTPVFRSQVEPEYLLLIERANAADQLAQLGVELATYLHQAGISTAGFFFSGDPRVCAAIDFSFHSHLTPLHELPVGEVLDRYPAHRLLILSDASRAFNAYTGRLEPGWEQLQAEPDKVLLTPAPPRHWGRREAMLEHLGFPVLTVTPNRIQYLLHLFGNQPLPAVEKPFRSETPLFQQTPHRWLDRIPPEPEIVERLFQQLQQHLGGAGFLWLAALAVYPEIHWGLTIRLGKNLVRDEAEFQRLLPLLTQLVWLREAYLPDWFRQALLARLTPEEEQQVRRLMVGLLTSLETAKHPEQVPLSIAVPPEQNLWQRLKTWWTRRQQLADTIHRPDPHPELNPLRETVCLEFLSLRRLGLLTPLIPQLLLRLLFPQGASLLGLRLPALAFAGLLAWTLPYFWFTRPPETQVDALPETLQFSPNVRTLISYDNQGGAHVWNTSPLLPQLTFQADGEQANIERATFGAFSPDGTLAIIGGLGESGKVAQLWDVETGKPYGQPMAHQYPVSCVAFSPDGTLVATAEDNRSLSGTIQLWEVKTSKPSGRPVPIGLPVYQMVITPNGQFAMTVDSRGRVISVNFQRNSSSVLAEPSQINSVAVHPSGERFVTGNGNGLVEFWDMATAKPFPPKIIYDRDDVTCVSFSPDGELALAGSNQHRVPQVINTQSDLEDRPIKGGTIRLWDVKTGEPYGLPMPCFGYVQCATFSPDGGYLIAGGGESDPPYGWIQLWAVKTGQPVGPPLLLQSAIWNLAFSPNGDEVLTTTTDGLAQLWELGTLGSTQPWETENRSFQQMRTSGEGRWILTLDKAGQAQLWEKGKAKPHFNFPAAGASRDCLINRDGTQAVLLSQDGRLTLWKLRDQAGRVSASMKFTALASEETQHLAWVRDELEVLTWGDEDTIRLWEVTDGGPLVQETDLEGIPRLLTWSRDGAKAYCYTSQLQRYSIEINRRDGGFQVGVPEAVVRIPDGVATSPDGLSLLEWRGNQLTLVTPTSEKAAWNFTAGTKVRSAGFGTEPGSMYVLDESGTLTFQNWSGLLLELPEDVDPRKLSSQEVLDLLPRLDRDFANLVAESAWANQTEPLPPGENPLTRPLLLNSISEVAQVAPSPNGRTLAVVVLADGPTQLRDLQTGNLLVDPLPHESPVRTVAFPPESNPTTDLEVPATLATVTADAKIHLWNIQTVGKAYALIVNGHHQADKVNTPDLARSQLTELTAVLESRYGFEVQVLESPGFDQLAETWSELQKKLTPQDLFVLVLRGESIPQDQEFALMLNPKDFLPASTISEFFRRLPARKALLITDGSHSRRLALEDAAKPLTSGRSRCLLCPSGEVPRAGDNFIRHLTQALLNLQGPFPAEKLVQAISAASTPGLPSGQEAVYLPLAESGHESGEVYFPRSQTPVPREFELPATTP